MDRLSETYKYKDIIVMKLDFSELMIPEKFIKIKGYYENIRSELYGYLKNEKYPYLCSAYDADESPKKRFYFPTYKFSIRYAIEESGGILSVITYAETARGSGEKYRRIIGENWTENGDILIIKDLVKNPRKFKLCGKCTNFHIHGDKIEVFGDTFGKDDNVFVAEISGH